MKHLSPAHGMVSSSLDFILRKVFGLDYSHEMPKVDDASRAIRFMLTEDFNEKFETWAAEMEKTHGGKLKITHEEPIVAGGTTMGFVMWWRIDPGAHVASRRGR